MKQTRRMAVVHQQTHGSHKRIKSQDESSSITKSRFQRTLVKLEETKINAENLFMWRYEENISELFKNI
jgi:hypothetical protein